MAIIMPHSAMIHVPKTGGTWCRVAIARAEILHFESGPLEFTRVQRFHAPFSLARDTIMVENWEQQLLMPVHRFTFGFVRNPITWLESRWADALEQGHRPRTAELRTRTERWFFDCFADTFSEFVARVLEVAPSVPSSNMLGRLGYHRAGQTWQQDEHKLDFIGRNENLVEDFLKALRMTGEEFDEAVIRAVVPQRVASRLTKYKGKCEWQPEQRAALYAANRYVFDNFGYPNPTD